MKLPTTVIVGTGVSGFIVIIAAIALGWFGFPALISHKIKHSVLLVNGTEGYERWRKLPVALWYKVYFFNVTNPEEVQNGANPVVREVGPYVYDQYREKFDIKGEDDYTLTYLENSTFYFNKEKTGNLSEDDAVTILDTVLLGTALNVKRTFGPDVSMNSVMREIIPGSDSVFQTATVRDLLWDGVTVVDCTGDDLSSEAQMICGMIKPYLPVMVSEQEPGIFKMAFLRYMNNSNDGRYRVNTGISEIRALGRIERWKGQPNLSIWSGEFCNSINGTDSTIAPPFWTAKDTVSIFVVNLCRSLLAVFESEITWKGVPALHFVSSRHNYESAQEYPPNICFCEDVGDEQPNCLKSGAFNLYPCVGVPLIASWPHLYNASPDYQLYVQGLNPDKEKHESAIDIEPESGAIVRGYKRVQLNMFLTRLKTVNALHNVSEGLFPVVWVDEGAEIDDKNLATLHQLYTVICILKVLRWLLIAVGILLMCVSIYLCVFKRKSNTKITQMEDNNRVVFAYENKMYMDEPEDMNDTLPMSAISDVIRNEQIGINKRKTERFPRKLYSRSEPNETNESVGLGVSRDAHGRVTLSNVFM